ncbi:hypothetical protein SAMN05216337_1001228 [Bradyrhizobium brasilense]|uniref:Uncharacterized protein n=1 Tax=Bradyrhizobium brasilense TaxID=1419277 RepID=A0A1G6IR10_9BRAD|nr:hypothetical protein [Bradyrhizobium brasilense]SDC09012.1 hypothetical protein SAMN05216337_1001228 [Bradyrhizobium brasilense]
MSLHEATVSSTITDEMRAQWEAESRAREARLEYGRTVEDLRRLLKRALSIQIAVRVGSDSSSRDCNFPFVTASAVRRMFRSYQADEIVPCEFDPIDRQLVIGGIRSIHKAWDLP